MIGIFSFIPAPPFDSISFVRIYGITMATGIGVGALIAHKRYSSRHNGSMAIIDMFLPTVLAGIVGARIYHLFTGYNWEDQGWSGVINLRNGGLSIWGAVFFGGLAVFVQARMKKISFLELGDAIVPGLLVAQAIGRIGNYFNQELFGRELNAFWALKVDELYRPSGLENVLTYHPTFLYEMLWTLSLAFVIVLAEKKFSWWAKGQSIALYVAGYCFGRVFLEVLRVDQATKVFGIRFNLLLSAALCCVGVIWFILLFKFNHKVREKSSGQ